jgi:hypothetical protein
METPESDPGARAAVRGTTGPSIADLVARMVEARPVARGTAGVDWSLRAFVAAIEAHRPGARPSGERPRPGLILAAGLLCALVVTGFLAWPALVTTVRHASRATGVAAARPAQAATAEARAGSTRAPGLGAPIGSAPSNGPNPMPSPVVQSGAAPPGAAPAPVAGPAATQQPAPLPLVAQPATPTPNSNTAPGSRVVTPSSLNGSGWNSIGNGGYPSFNGPSCWTTNTGATATWTLTGVTSQNVTVQVWIANTMAGALVAYTINGGPAVTCMAQPTTANGKCITQEWHNNWQTINVVGPFTSSGTLTVTMTYKSVAHPQSTPDPSCINSQDCTSMSAAQVQFSWS